MALPLRLWRYLCLFLAGQSQGVAQRHRTRCHHGQRNRINLEDLPAELRGHTPAGTNGSDPSLEVGSLVSMEQLEEAHLRKVLERTSNLAEPLRSWELIRPRSPQTQKDWVGMIALLAGHSKLLSLLPHPLAAALTGGGPQASPIPKPGAGRCAHTYSPQRRALVYFPLSCSSAASAAASFSCPARMLRWQGREPGLWPR